ncbi:MAG: hypothetical protein ABIF40_03645 [archaeon]
MVTNSDLEELAQKGELMLIGNNSPVLQIPQAPWLKQAYWVICQRLGMDVERLREEYFTSAFKKSYGDFKSDVDNFAERVKRLEKQYLDTAENLRKDEQRCRDLEVKISAPYELNIQLLGWKTDNKEPVYDNLTSEQIIEKREKLNTALHELSYLPSETVQEEYNQTPEKAREAIEHVLFLLEKEEMEREDAQIELTVLQGKLKVFRARRQDFRENLQRQKSELYQHQVRCELASDGEVQAEFLELATASRKLNADAEHVFDRYMDVVQVADDAMAALPAPTQDPLIARVNNVLETKDEVRRLVAPKQKSK